MRIINKNELEQQKPSILKALATSIFIYPTDSIYGLGCDATNETLVQKVRELKNSTLQQFSVIAPSKQWVYDNCHITTEAQQWVEQLGEHPLIEGQKTAFSLILELKNLSAVAPSVLQGSNTLSVRIPKHWFSNIIAEMNIPVVSTAANPTGGYFMTSLEDLHERLKVGIDYLIYIGEQKGRPSTLVHCDKETISIKAR